MSSSASTRVTLLHVVLVAMTLLGVWVVGACNGILGNEIREADAGSEASSEKCPVNTKFCEAINSCSPTTDTAFGCGAASCDPCSVPHATAKCGGTGCVVDTCFPGFQKCGPNGTCVDVTVPADCGTCGKVCPSSSPFCAPSGTTFACQATCQPPLQACSSTGQCFDLASSPAHCGGCDNDCGKLLGKPLNGNVTCISGKCQLECLTGFRTCGAPGKETCERQDVNHCGPSCGPCPMGPNATPTCERGGSNVFACGFACNPSMPPAHDYKQCADAPGCVDLASDPAHCGSCGKKCVVQATGACSCANGKCSINCISL